MVPKLLTAEQKDTWLNICVDILENIENDPKFLKNGITCGDHVFFQYDPETKRQFMHWKITSSPRRKKTRISKSKFNAMMIVFFSKSEKLFTSNSYLKIELLTTYIIRRIWQPFVNV